MKDATLKTYRLPLLYSVMLHAALFVCIFMQADSERMQDGITSPTALSSPLAQSPTQAPIKATSIDSQVVESELVKIKQREAQETAFKEQELQKLQQAKIKAQQAQEEYKKIQTAKQQLQKEIQKNKLLAEQQKMQALAEQKKAEKAKQELATLKKKQAAEAAELKKQQQAAAELKKKQAAIAEQKKTKKIEADVKKKELEQTLEPPKKEKTEPASQKNDAKPKNDTEEARSQKQLDEEALASENELSELENLLPSEKKNAQNQNAHELTAQQLSEIDKYRLLITQSIGQNWIVPDNVDKHLSCELIIRVAPGGAVLSVTLAKSSGNPTLDRSAQTAVMKASPLPVPTDGTLFNKFRELSLVVRPEDF